MRCPICRSSEQTETDLHSDGFKEEITECNICGATWSDNHGWIEVVKDPQVASFLEAQSDCVEGDDYSVHPL